jgi:hypothetical protein
MNLSSGLIRDKRKVLNSKLVYRNSSQSPKSIFYVKIPMVTREDNLLDQKYNPESHSNQKTASEFRIRVKVKTPKISRDKHPESLKQFKMPEVNLSRSFSKLKNTLLRGVNINDSFKKQQRCFSNSNTRRRDSERFFIPGKYKKIVVTLNNLLS